MHKHRKLITLAACIITAVVAILFLIPNPEPHYGGRSLSDWLTFYQENQNDRPSPELAEAEKAIRSIGTNALPFLLQWIRYEPAPWRRTMLLGVPSPLANNGSFRRWIDGAGPERASRALLGFQLLGTNASSALPELTAIIRSPNPPGTSRRAIFAVSKLGEPALQLLSAELANPQQLNRVSIARALTIMALSLGTNACVPPLVKALQDSDPSVRAAATRTLQRIAPEALTNAPPVPARQ